VFKFVLKVGPVIRTPKKGREKDVDEIQGKIKWNTGLLESLF